MSFKKLKYWFGKELATLLAEKIGRIRPAFDQSLFIKNIGDSIESLELKDRVEVISDELYKQLGSDYPTDIQVLLQILGPENEEETGMFTNYYWVMPIAKYVEKYGLDDFKLSINAIKEITKRNTGEYAIRPYLEKYQKKTLTQMLHWSKDSNVHVRRLSSEGVRPRLPWASKLEIFIHDPKPIIPILNNLKDDPSKFVQKSVANCINDIMKDNYEVGKSIIEDWNGVGMSNERKWIIKHALRTLIKKDDKWAMAMIK